VLERERELALLQQAWREARAGGGSAWLVCAEAGGGKTRLLREATRGLPVRWGTAEPVVPPDPYLAVMQALRGFRPAPHRADSIARALEHMERLAGDGPIVLVLDDLHFADEGTIAVFVRLAFSCATRPWLLLGAQRLGEGSEALRLATTELVAQGHAHRLDLAPLSRAAVASVAAAVRGHAAGADEVETLYADSGGNPWFVEALARGAGTIAATRDRILLRLDRLERQLPGASNLLALLAPAGEPLPHAVVAALGGGDGPALRQLLRGLRDAAVLREQDGGWQFRHELLRRSLMDAMLEADRRDAHRRLAEALEGLASPATLAMHFAEAGDRRTADWALRAAWQARIVDAHAEALAQLERALAFPLAPEGRRRALRGAAQIAWYLGRFSESVRLAEEGLAIAGGEPEVISRLHQHAADAARVLGQTQAALGHMDAAERVLEGRPASEQAARIATARAWEAAALIHPERAEALSEQAIAVARALTDRQTGARYELAARCYRGLSLLDAGDPAGFVPFEERFEFGTADAETAREAVPQALNAYAYAVRALFHAEAERFRGWLLDGIAQHHLDWEPRAGPYHLLELVQRGTFAEARARLEQLAAPPPRTMEHTIFLVARALLETRAGSPARAQAGSQRSAVPGAFAHTALLDLIRLDQEAFESSDAISSRAEADRGDAPADGGPALLPVAELYARAAGRRFARLAGMAALALARGGAPMPPRPDWLVADAPLGVFWTWADALERRDGAALRGVAATLTAMDCPYEAALALRDAGELQEAYRALRALGATPARERLARMIQATGGSIPRGPRGSGGPGALTDTERAVGRLVAGGATSAAVAAALGMGVRTVDAHLSRIYEKTGRRGRVALAAWWAEFERESSSTGN
jgi:DNA-binding CsgD family transcriptional regulator